MSRLTDTRTRVVEYVRRSEHPTIILVLAAIGVLLLLVFVLVVFLNGWPDAGAETAAAVSENASTSSDEGLSPLEARLEALAADSAQKAFDLAVERARSETLQRIVEALGGGQGEGEMLPQASSEAAQQIVVSLQAITDILTQREDDESAESAAADCLTEEQRLEILERLDPSN